MNVQISPDLSRFVEGLVADGKYQNGDQVFAEGLRLLQAREQLRRDVDAGIAQLDRGEGLDEDAVFDVLDGERTSEGRLNSYQANAAVFLSKTK